MMGKIRTAMMLPIGMVILAACSATPPPMEAPLEAMAPQDWKDWKAPNAQAYLSWQSFNDPILAGLIEQGLTSSLAIDNARLTFERAKLGLLRTDASQRPAVNFRSSHSQSGQLDGKRAGNTSLSLTASYELDFWGVKDNHLSLAGLSAESGRIRLEAARISLASSITIAYFQVRAIDKIITLKQKSLEKAREQRKFVNARYKVRRTVLADLDRQDVLIARLQAAIEDLKADRISKVHDLAILLGKVPEGFSLEPVELALTSPPILKPDTPLATLRNRPDIKLAELGLKQQNIQAELLRKRYYPTIALSAGLSTSSKSIGDLFDVISKPWNLVASLSYPLIDNGAYQAEKQQSEIDRKLQLNQYKSSILSALRDMETALANQESVLHRYEIFLKEKASQQRVSAETKIKYNNGRADALDLILDENALIAVEENEVNIWLRMNLSSVSLLRSMGVAPDNL